MFVLFAVIIVVTLLLGTKASSIIQPVKVVDAVNGQPGLKDYAGAQNFKIGVATNALYPNRVSEPTYWEIIFGEFNSLSIENETKWGPIHPRNDYPPGNDDRDYNFSGPDRFVVDAQNHNMVLRGHSLLWHSQNPQWLIEKSNSIFADGQWTSAEWDEMMTILKTHIKKVVGRYKGKIKYWDVVNETFYWIQNNTCRLNVGYNPFYPNETLAYEAIKNAFIWAHEADPDAILFLNENWAEDMNWKSQCVYNLVSRLKADNVPIHAVGMQMHRSAFESSTFFYNFERNLTRLTDLGLEIHISEMDLSIEKSTTPTSADFQAQAYTYKRITETCLRVPGCKSITIWGLTDKYSWLTQHDPTLFFADYSPKPAYYSVLEAFQANLPLAPTPPQTPTPTPTPTNSPLPLTGDLNSDGVVNIQDFVALSNVFGTNDGRGDLNSDGVVNIQDFVILSNNFGQTSPTQPPTPTPTPTPVSGTCPSGYGDCDGNPDNGCETSLNTNSNCGSCGYTCTRNEVCRREQCIYREI